MRVLLQDPDDCIARSDLMWDSAMMDSVQLLTSGTLKEIADSCDLIQTGQAQLSHMEVYEILESCV